MSEPDREMRTEADPAIPELIFETKPTGLPPEEEEKIVKMLEDAADESMRAIGCNETFIIPKDDEMKEIPPTIYKVRPTGLPQEEEDELCKILEKAADEARRDIG